MTVIRSALSGSAGTASKNRLASADPVTPTVPAGSRNRGWGAPTWNVGAVLTSTADNIPSRPKRGEPVLVAGHDDEPDGLRGSAAAQVNTPAHSPCMLDE
jgi:hypothetical protein